MTFEFTQEGKKAIETCQLKVATLEQPTTDTQVVEQIKAAQTVLASIFEVAELLDYNHPNWHGFSGTWAEIQVRRGKAANAWHEKYIKSGEIDKAFDRLHRGDGSWAVIIKDDTSKQLAITIKQLFECLENNWKTHTKNYPTDGSQVDYTTLCGSVIGTIANLFMPPISANTHPTQLLASAIQQIQASIDFYDTIQKEYAKKEALTNNLKTVEKTNLAMLLWDHPTLILKPTFNQSGGENKLIETSYPISETDIEKLTTWDKTRKDIQEMESIVKKYTTTQADNKVLLYTRPNKTDKNKLDVCLLAKKQKSNGKPYCFIDTIEKTDLATWKATKINYFNDNEAPGFYRLSSGENSADRSALDCFRPENVLNYTETIETLPRADEIKQLPNLEALNQPIISIIDRFILSAEQYVKTKKIEKNVDKEKAELIKNALKTAKKMKTEWENLAQHQQTLDKNGYFKLQKNYKFLQLVIHDTAISEETKKSYTTTFCEKLKAFYTIIEQDIQQVANEKKIILSKRCPQLHQLISANFDAYTTHAKPFKHFYSNDFTRLKQCLSAKNNDPKYAALCQKLEHKLDTETTLPREEFALIKEILKEDNDTSDKLNPPNDVDTLNAAFSELHQFVVNNLLGCRALRVLTNIQTIQPCIQEHTNIVLQYASQFGQTGDMLSDFYYGLLSELTKENHTFIVKNEPEARNFVRTAHCYEEAKQDYEKFKSELEKNQRLAEETEKQKAQQEEEDRKISEQIAELEKQIASLTENVKKLMIVCGKLSIETSESPILDETPAEKAKNIEELTKNVEILKESKDKYQKLIQDHQSQKKQAIVLCQRKIALQDIQQIQQEALKNLTEYPDFVNQQAEKLKNIVDPLNALEGTMQQHQVRLTEYQALLDSGKEDYAWVDSYQDLTETLKAVTDTENQKTGFIEKTEQYISDVQKAKETYEKALTQLKAQAKEKKEKIEKLQELNKLENQDYQEIIAKLTAIATVSSEKEKYQSIETLQKTIQDAEAMIQQIETAAKEAQAKLNASKQKLEKIYSSVMALETVKNDKGLLSAIETTNKQAIESNSDQQIDELTTQLENLSKTIQHYDEASAEFAKTIKSYVAICEEIKCDVNNSLIQEIKLTGEYKNLSSYQDHFEETIKAIKKKNQGLIQETEQQKAQQEEEDRKISEQIAELEKQIASLKQDIEKLINCCKTLSIETTELPILDKTPAESAQNIEKLTKNVNILKESKNNYQTLLKTHQLQTNQNIGVYLGKMALQDIQQIQQEALKNLTEYPDFIDQQAKQLKTIVEQLNALEGTMQQHQASLTEYQALLDSGKEDYAWVDSYQDLTKTLSAVDDIEKQKTGLIEKTEQYISDVQKAKATYEEALTQLKIQAEEKLQKLNNVNNLANQEIIAKLTAIATVSSEKEKYQPIETLQQTINGAEALIQQIEQAAKEAQAKLEKSKKQFETIYSSVMTSEAVNNDNGAKSVIETTNKQAMESVACQQIDALTTQLESLSNTIQAYDTASAEFVKHKESYIQRCEEISCEVNDSLIQEIKPEDKYEDLSTYQKHLEQTIKEIEGKNQRLIEVIQENSAHFAKKQQEKKKLEILQAKQEVSKRDDQLKPVSEINNPQSAKRKGKIATKRRSLSTNNLGELKETAPRNPMPPKIPSLSFKNKPFFADQAPETPRKVIAWDLTGEKDSIQIARSIQILQNKQKPEFIALQGISQETADEIKEKLFTAFPISVFHPGEEFEMLRGILGEDFLSCPIFPLADFNKQESEMLDAILGKNWKDRKSIYPNKDKVYLTQKEISTIKKTLETSSNIAENAFSAKFVTTKITDKYTENYAEGNVYFTTETIEKIRVELQKIAEEPQEEEKEIKSQYAIKNKKEVANALIQKFKPHWYYHSDVQSQSTIFYRTDLYETPTVNETTYSFKLKGDVETTYQITQHACPQDTKTGVIQSLIDADKAKASNMDTNVFVRWLSIISVQTQAQVLCISKNSIFTGMHTGKFTSSITPQPITELNPHTGETLDDIAQPHVQPESSITFPGKDLTNLNAPRRALTQYQTDLRTGLNDQNLEVCLGHLNDQPSVILTVETSSPLIPYLRNNDTNPNQISIQANQKNPARTHIIVNRQNQSIDHLHKHVRNYETIPHDLKIIWQALTKELTVGFSLNPLRGFQHYQAIDNRLKNLTPATMSLDELKKLHQNVQHLLTTKTVKWSLTNPAQWQLQRLERYLAFAIFNLLPQQNNQDNIALSALINNIQILINNTKQDGKQSHTGLKRIEAVIKNNDYSATQKFLTIQKIAHERLESHFFNRFFRSEKVDELYRLLRSTPLIIHQQDTAVINTEGLNKITNLH